MMRAFTRWRLTREIKIAIRAIRRMEKTMAALGIPRHQRKQMFRDFIKSEASRKGLVDILVGATK